MYLEGGMSAKANALHNNKDKPTAGGKKFRLKNKGATLDTKQLED